MLFTERFNEILKISGAKQTELAKFCNVSKQSITGYKSGSAFPSIEVLYKLCQYLDCTSDYLLGLSDI